jgi:hypothetical protein
MASTQVLNIKTGKMENCTVGAGCKKHAHADSIKNLASVSEDVLDFKWYRFDQNNSGGSFSQPALNIIVKARNGDEANQIAQDVGVYFDPEFQIDCECCGNRWEKFGSSEGVNDYSIFKSEKDVIDYLKATEPFTREVPYYMLVN